MERHDRVMCDHLREVLRRHGQGRRAPVCTVFKSQKPSKMRETSKAPSGWTQRPHPPRCDHPRGCPEPGRSRDMEKSATTRVMCDHIREVLRRHGRGDVPPVCTVFKSQKPSKMRETRWARFGVDTASTPPGCVR
jgi:hypothetical protein